VLQLGGPARGVLLAPGSERGTDGALDVAEHRVDSLECKVTRGLPAGASDDRLVHATRVGDAIEAAEPVGDEALPARLQALGIRDGIARRGNRWHDMSRWNVRRNELISYSRAPVEPLFALLKNTYRFARARHRGLFAMPPNSTLRLPRWTSSDGPS
jgi:IS5 family transposase